MDVADRKKDRGVNAFAHAAADRIAARHRNEPARVRGFVREMELMEKRMGTFSDQVRRLIADSGLSSYRLSQLSGVPESTLSRFLRGERTITLETLDRLSAALRLELKGGSRRRRSRASKARPRR